MLSSVVGEEEFVFCDPHNTPLVCYIPNLRENPQFSRILYVCICFPRKNQSQCRKKRTESSFGRSKLNLKTNPTTCRDIVNSGNMREEHVTFFPGENPRKPPKEGLKGSHQQPLDHRSFRPATVRLRAELRPEK
jgi:hypothetical protein